MVEVLQDLQLTIFVLLVLEDPLDSNHVQSLFITSLMNNPESATPNLIFKSVTTSPSESAGLFPILILGLAVE